MNIYVVMGSCGEYSDHTEWPVKAFDTEAGAQTFVERCTEEGNRVRSASGQGVPWSVPGREPHALDSNFTWDNSGFNYYYFDVELEAVTDDRAGSRDATVSTAPRESPAPR